MSLPRGRRVKIPINHPAEAVPVPIVSDPIMATKGIGQGSFIPVLILDTSERQDIETMVEAHRYLGSGDVRCNWTIHKRPFGLDSPRLILQITKPSKCVVIIEFDLAKSQGVLVDQILWAQGVYLQPGRPGDRIATAYNNLRILVEAPTNIAFQARFRLLHEKAIVRRLRKRGLNRQQSRRAAREIQDKYRSVFRTAVPFHSNTNGTAGGKEPLEGTHGNNGSAETV